MTLFVERRRPALTPDLLVRVTLAWAMIAALLLVTNLTAILAFRFPDPDDALRLVQVRDLIAGQGWFDLAQHRAGSTPMHWSRLVDLPLAGAILALQPLLGGHGAELAAAIIVPLLTLFVCLLLIGRIAWRLLGEEQALFACLAFALSVPVIEQLRPMRIDHHGWQIALVLLALNGMLARSPRVGGWIVGGALALGLSISIELLPIAAAFMGVFALRWLRSRADRRWLVSAMQSLAAVSVLAFLATRPAAWGTLHCDAITPLHIGLFAWGALVLSVSSALEPQPRATLLAGFALAAGGAVAAVLTVAPACANGAFAALDPLVRTMWLERISEGLPVWRQSLPQMLQIVIPSLIALLASVRLAGRSSGWLRSWWIDYTLLLAAAFVVSVFVSRAGAVAGALAAIPIGWQLREWLRQVRHRCRPVRRVAIYGGVAMALVPAAPALLLVSAVPSRAELAPPAIVHRSGAQCMVSSAPTTLAALPAGRVLAPLDIAPQVLLHSDHSVIATGHHRAPKMATVIRAFVSKPAAARILLQREGIDYLALCPAANEPRNYAFEAPEGLAAHLLNDRAPTWLERVPALEGDGWVVWGVRPAS